MSRGKTLRLHIWVSHNQQVLIASYHGTETKLKVESKSPLKCMIVLSHLMRRDSPAASSADRMLGMCASVNEQNVTFPFFQIRKSSALTGPDDTC